MTRTSWLGTASVVAIALATSIAHAQDAQSQDNNTESVTVTGMRASINSALDLKRNASRMQDSIVAVDIGKLPDTTVVEALQHVPGISILRNNVEPTTVLIRGLPDIATLLNGREIFSTTGRFVSLPDFPAELLARVDVHKSSSATDIEGGIAGLIDMRLHRPFDFDGLQLAGNVQAVNESHAGHVDPQASFLVSDRWSTGIGDVGLLLDVSFKSIHNQEWDILTNQRTATVSPVASAVAGSPANLPAGAAAIPGTITFYNRAGLIERSSVNFSSQWKPADNLEFYGEYFYTRLRQKAPTDVDVFIDSVLPDPIKTTVYPNSNVAQTYASSGASVTSLQDLRQKEDTQQFAVGGSWNALDALTVTSEFDYTISNFESTNLIPDDQYAVGQDGLSYINNVNGSDGTFVATNGNPQLKPAGEFIDQWYDQHNIRRGSEWDWRADASYDFKGTAVGGFLERLDLGYRYTSRSAKNRQPSNSGLNCNANQAGAIPSGSISYNQYIITKMTSPACTGYMASLVGGASPSQVGGISLASLPTGAYHTIHGSYWGGGYGVSSWTNIDPNWLYQNENYFRSLYGYTGPQAFVPTFSFDTREKSNAGYMMANYAFEVAGFPVDGNFGFRYVETSLLENAFTQTYVPLNPAVGPTVAPNATCTTCVQYTPTSATKMTYDFMPSINVRMTLADDLYLRVAASKTVTRPTFAQLNPGITLSAPTATLLTGTASSGNANLSPEKSINVDLGMEYYWGHANHVAGAIFNRDVTGYIQNVATPITVGGVNYTLTAPANVQNATIKGAELAYSQFLDFLPDFWSGFGWDVNATYLDGIFNNISKWGVNASGIYEQGPYSFRLSYTWRSSFQANTTFTPGVQPGIRIASPRDNMDVSFNYTLNDNLILTLDGTNIIGSVYRDHAGRGALNELYYAAELESFDRIYSIGLRYRL